MSDIPESSIVGQRWRVNMCCIEVATEENIFGNVSVRNLENTLDIFAKWKISKKYRNVIDDDSWGEVEFNDENPILVSCNAEGEWEESSLIDGDGDYVNYDGEAFCIIEGTNWRQMIPDLDCITYESEIKHFVNLETDGDADIAYFIKRLPDFANWVRKHALAEMYP